MSKDAVRVKLIDFYTTFAEVPEEAKLAKIIAQDRPEQDLFAALANKYKVDAAAVEKRRVDVSRVVDFYEKYAPKQLEKVPQIMSKAYKGKIADLLNALRNKYSISEEDFPNEASSAPKAKPAKKPEPKKEEESAEEKQQAPAAAEATPTVAPPAAAVPPTAQSMPVVTTPVQAAPVSTAGVQKGVKEETLLLREASLRALEAAIEVKASSFASLPRTFNVTAFQRDPGEYSSAAAADYVEQLSCIEAGLLKKCAHLQEINHSVAKQRKVLDQEEADLKGRLASFQRDLESFLQTRRQSEDTLSAARATVRANEEDAARRLAEVRSLEGRMEARLSDIEAREQACASKEAALSGREAGLEEKLSIAAQERDLAQKITAEVITREATVRAVEKSMNDARRELSAIEVEVSKRAKQLAGDEASVRKWAASLEEREVKLEEKLNLLKKKGTSK